MKFLSHHVWGADKATLLIIYRTLIRTKIDYRSILYSTSKPHHLKRIEAISNTAIRIASGAFKTSPIESLLAEASEPPLQIRQKQLAISYITKLASDPSNPTYNSIFQNTNNIITIQTETPLQKYIAAITENSPFPQIIHSNHTGIPPWKLNTTNINTELTKYNKKDTPKELYLNRFYELQNTIYKNYTYVYTDGSKSNNHIGAGVIIEKKK